MSSRALLMSGIFLAAVTAPQAHAKPSDRSPSGIDYSTSPPGKCSRNSSELGRCFDFRNGLSRVRTLRDCRLSGGGAWTDRICSITF